MTDLSIGSRKELVNVSNLATLHQIPKINESKYGCTIMLEE
jgi:hypothetical protein